MPINVIYDYHPTGHRHHITGQITGFIGLLLLLAGLIALIPLILFCIAIISSFIDTGSFPDIKDAYGITAIATVIAIILIIPGRRLIRGTRRLVLFLRRFGFVDATQALTFALATAIGKSWRVVTLDDTQVAPVGVKGGARWVSRVIGIVAIVIVSLALVWAFGGGFEEMLSGVMNQQMEAAENPIAGFVTAIVVGLAAGLIILGIVLIPAAFFVSVSFFTWGVNVSVHQAERSKVTEITDVRTIVRTSRKVSRQARGVFSPRLMVVQVASKVWKESVRSLAEKSSAIIIDISEPSDNLLWEVTTLKPIFGSRWVLTGERNHLFNLINSVEGNQSPVIQNLLTILEDETVIAYTNEKKNRKQFARILREKLDSLPETKHG